jgi:regulator of RNase E activity RraA
MPQPIDASLLQRLASCDTPTIGHFRNRGFMDTDLSAVIPGIRAVGTAVTISMPPGDSTLGGYVVSIARPGDFIVIDRCGDRKNATWGGVVAYAASLAGIAGAIVDGLSTDFSEQREYGVPCWSRGAGPITCRLTGSGGGVNVPVNVAGVVVNPGDAILADESGIFVCNPDELLFIVEEVEKRQANEKITLEKLKAGAKMSDLVGSRKMVQDALAKTGKVEPW